jgi:hypothetical protein
MKKIKEGACIVPIVKVQTVPSYRVAGRPPGKKLWSVLLQFGMRGYHLDFHASKTYADRYRDSLEKELKKCGVTFLSE